MMALPTTRLPTPPELQSMRKIRGIREEDMDAVGARRVMVMLGLEVECDGL
jgi:hypothetical protein